MRFTHLLVQSDALSLSLGLDYVFVCVCRENEVLKVQLKKYVGAVQMLKREGSQGNDTGKTPRTHSRTMLRI